MATTENTLRTRQNMEILDVWKNLSSQVNALTKRQIAVFPDTVKPKTQRDLEVEVNVDKTVEALNNALETRLANLEFVLKNDAQLREVVVRPARRVERDSSDESSDVSSSDSSSSSSDAPSEQEIPPYIDTTELGKEDRKRANASNKIRERLLMERAKREKQAERFQAERRAERKGRIGKEDIKLLPFQNAYQDVVTTGAIVSQWNNIVRFFQKQGLSKQSQEMIKVKVQDLVPNLEALLYGLGQAVDALFSHPSYTNQVGMKILELLRTQSVYQLIKTQIDTASFEILSVSGLDTAFKNIFAELSQERRELLDEISVRESGRITDKPIRIIPKFSTQNFEERLKALASELGINPSSLPDNLVNKLKAMNQADFEKATGELLVETKRRGVIRDTKQQKAIEELQRRRLELAHLERENSVVLPARVRMLEENIRLAEADEKYEVGALGAQEPLIDLPNVSNPPSQNDFYDVDIQSGEEILDESAYRRAVDEYERQKAEYDRVVAMNEQIENDNMMREVLGAFDDTQKQEVILSLKRQLKETTDEADQNALRANALQSKIATLTSQLSALANKNYRQPSAFIRTTITNLDALANAYAGNFQKTKGRGKPIDSRGLAGMGSHYGAEDDSEEEDDSESESESEGEDPLAFDDRRNDSYYSRPARR